MGESSSAPLAAEPASPPAPEPPPPEPAAEQAEAALRAAIAGGGLAALEAALAAAPLEVREGGVGAEALWQLPAGASMNEYVCTALADLDLSVRPARPPRGPAESPRLCSRARTGSRPRGAGLPRTIAGRSKYTGEMSLP